MIDHVGHHGDGVAIAGGGNIYVPYTLGGETIEVGPVPGHHPDRRRLLNVEAASLERIAPFCPHFGVCGGCAIQHWDAAAYRAWKRELVVTTLAQAGIDCDVAPLVDAHGAGRRRITLHGRMGTHDVLKVGYAAAGSHDIIPIDRCPILDPGLNGAIEAAWAVAEPLIAMGKPLDIQVTATNSGLDVDVRGSGPLSVAVTWMSSGFPIEISGSAMAQAASIAPSRCGSSIGQRSIGTMSCELAAANPTLRTSCVPIRACSVMRRRPRPWASTRGATSQSIPPCASVVTTSSRFQAR